MKASMTSTAQASGWDSPNPLLHL